MKVNGVQGIPALSKRNKFGVAAGYGFANFGKAQFGDDNIYGGVYQRRHTGYNQTGRIPGRKRETYYVLMQDCTPNNPNSTAQQAGRTKFHDAVVAWQGLTDPQKFAYNSRRDAVGKSGYNIFISEYMLSH